ncbi:MAG: hypothetical protein ACR2FN_09050 [Chitinophagaceae bacterium]
MKKFLLFATLLLGIQFSYAALPGTTSNSKSNNLTEKQLTDQQRTAMQQLVKLSVKDYEALTGKNLNFFQRESFKFSQNRMRHELRRDRDDRKWIWIGLGALIVLVLILIIH